MKFPFAKILLTRVRARARQSEPAGTSRWDSEHRDCGRSVAGHGPVPSVTTDCHTGRQCDCPTLRQPRRAAAGAPAMLRKKHIAEALLTAADSPKPSKEELMDRETRILGRILQQTVDFRAASARSHWQAHWHWHEDVSAYGGQGSCWNFLKPALHPLPACL